MPCELRQLVLTFVTERGEVNGEKINKKEKNW